MRIEDITYYDVLEISEEATPSEIRKAYLRKASECHPDKHSGGDEEQVERAKEAFQVISEGYENLYDPGLRESYDLRLAQLRLLAAERDPPPSSSPPPSASCSRGETIFSSPFFAFPIPPLPPMPPMPPRHHHPASHPFWNPYPLAETIRRSKRERILRALRNPFNKGPPHHIPPPMPFPSPNQLFNSGPFAPHMRGPHPHPHPPIHHYSHVHRGPNHTHFVHASFSSTGNMPPNFHSFVQDAERMMDMHTTQMRRFGMF